MCVPRQGEFECFFPLFTENVHRQPWTHGRVSMAVMSFSAVSQVSAYTKHRTEPSRVKSPLQSHHTHTIARRPPPPARARPPPRKSPPPPKRPPPTPPLPPPPVARAPGPRPCSPWGPWSWTWPISSRSTNLPPSSPGGRTGLTSWCVRGAWVRACVCAVSIEVYVDYAWAWALSVYAVSIELYVDHAWAWACVPFD